MTIFSNCTLSTCACLGLGAALCISSVGGCAHAPIVAGVSDQRSTTATVLPGFMPEQPGWTMTLPEYVRLAARLERVRIARDGRGFATVTLVNRTQLPMQLTKYAISGLVYRTALLDEGGLAYFLKPARPGDAQIPPKQTDMITLGPGESTTLEIGAFPNVGLLADGQRLGLSVPARPTPSKLWYLIRANLRDFTNDPKFGDETDVLGVGEANVVVE